jgi:hypothetical protein
VKVLLLALLLASIGGWSVRNVSNYEAIIVNNLNRDIQCYVYYSTGRYLNIYLPAHRSSYPFSNIDLEEVECY